jgi:uncharacterized protein (DUF427 family)
MKAELCGQLIAEAGDDDVVWVEGNAYFPPESLTLPSALTPSPRAYTCPWKGAAQYFDVVASGTQASAAAWSYPRLLPSAVNRVGADFSNFIAFDRVHVDVS